MCIVSVHVVGFCCWMFRGMGGGIVCKLHEKWTQICRKSDQTCLLEAWRGLGELLGHPWGLKVGPRVDFDGFLEHVKLPFCVFSDQSSVFFRTDLLTSFSIGLGIFILCSMLEDFWMKTGAWNKKGGFMKNVGSPK